MEKVIPGVVLAAFLAVLSVPFALYQLTTTQNVSITVTDKERINVNNDNNDSKYMVFSDGEVFQNSDAFFHLKFSSHDLYSRMKVGETYDCEVYGWRVPFLSMTRNIVDCK